MKKNVAISLLLLIFTSTYVFSQNHAPVAVNDTITVNSAGSYTFSPWANDYDPDGDPFSIYLADFLHHSGSITINYSSIDIKMKYASGVDTIAYFLKDNHNAISNIGYIFVTINNNHTNDTLNINNVSAPFYAIGNKFWDHLGTAMYEIPKGSGKKTIFTSRPWIGGLDSNNDLHITAEQFTSYGNDLFYGPVCDTNMLVMYSDTTFNRVWKITKDEINYHKHNYWKSSYIVPDAIANWPTEGDTLIGQSLQLAAFIDNNNDGIYNPSDGDYPKIRGDESVFMIYNDMKKPHTESGGDAMGVEFHQTAYAYNCPTDSALSNTIFMHYDIYNRSNNDYHNVYFTVFADFDIGYANDDYIGCDSTRSLFYAYNGFNIDGFNIPPKPSFYGINPPAQGVVFLSENMNSFMTSNNTYIPGIQTDPHLYYHCYNFMQAIWSDSTHLTYGGNGHGGTIPTNYIYSGDPNDTTTWSGRIPYPDSTNIIGIPFDRRGYGSIGPFTLNAGGIKSIDLAYVYARDTNKNNFENVDLLKAAVDKIQYYFDNDTTPCGGNFSAINKLNTNIATVNIYPNPVDNKLFIDYEPKTAYSIFEIFNINGKLIKYGKLRNHRINSVETNELSSGLYIIRILDGFGAISKKFIINH